ncbi:MAG TPA: hypothetical protein VES95_13335 [Dermatophilaceae bacterium]|nr:hypothetical protein [Dermatophilaceae bacterium]
MTSTSATRTSRRHRVGLVLAGLISLSSAFSLLGPGPPEGGPGPPLVVLWADTVLGVVGIVAVVLAWRSGSRTALRVAAGALIVAALTAVPAFFVDVPAPLKIAVALSVLLTLAAVVLMFSPVRRPASVTD